MITKHYEAETMAQEFFVLERKLQVSLDNSHSSKKNLVEEVFVLKKDMIDTSDTYIERENDDMD